MTSIYSQSACNFLPGDNKLQILTAIVGEIWGFFFPPCLFFPPSRCKYPAAQCTGACASMTRPFRDKKMPLVTVNCRV